jgi:hypothetical protein
MYPNKPSQSISDPYLWNGEEVKEGAKEPNVTEEKGTRLNMNEYADFASYPFHARYVS